VFPGTAEDVVDGTVRHEVWNIHGKMKMGERKTWSEPMRDHQTRPPSYILKTFVHEVHPIPLVPYCSDPIKLWQDQIAPITEF
jgi:hypothetical protein